MLMSMLMSHASVDVFVLSFVLPCDVVLMLMSLVKTRLMSAVMCNRKILSSKTCKTYKGLLLLA